MLPWRKNLSFYNLNYCCHLKACNLLNSKFSRPYFIFLNFQQKTSVTIPRPYSITTSNLIVYSAEACDVVLSRILRQKIRLLFSTCNLLLPSPQTFVVNFVYANERKRVPGLFISPLERLCKVSRPDQIKRLIWVVCLSMSLTSLSPAPLLPDF